MGEATAGCGSDSVKLTRQGVRDLGASARRPAFDRPRVAVDVHVSSRDIMRLRADGFDVVETAEPSEPDIYWLQRAAVAGANIVCSADLGVGEWARKHRMLFVRLPGGESYDSYQLIVTAWKRHLGERS